MNASPVSAERRVRCPGCGGPSLYAASNRWRPFCSERCREGDLGAWASETYRVPDSAPEDPQAPADLAAGRPHHRPAS